MEFIVKGTTDSVLTCECCGRQDLKKTVILNYDCLDLYYGVVCAARVLGVSKKEVTLKLKDIDTQSKKDAKKKEFLAKLAPHVEEMRKIHTEMMQYVDSLWAIRCGFNEFTYSEITNILRYEIRINTISRWEIKEPINELGKKFEILGIDLLKDIFLGLKVPPYFSCKYPSENESDIYVSFQLGSEVKTYKKKEIGY